MTYPLPDVEPIDRAPIAARHRATLADWLIGAALFIPLGVIATLICEKVF
jgi:hypothetical protein